MVIVDTSVWLQFLKSGEAAVRSEMNLLRAQDEIAMVGVVMAELLQGARSQAELEQLSGWLTALPYVAETQETWLRVGSLSFQLSRRGIAVPMPDLLIAALAVQHGHDLYTLDEHFQRMPGLKRYQPGE